MDGDNHAGTCKTCGTWINEKHAYNESGVCTVCGFEKHEHQVACYEPYKMEDGTFHLGNCSVCNLMIHQSHKMDGDTCKVCGYKNHNHTFAGVPYNQEFHKTACSECGLYTFEEHAMQNSVCTGCGYRLPNGALQLKVGTITSPRNREVLIPISFAENPGVSVVNFKIDYDKTALQLFGYEGAEGLDWTVNTEKNSGAVLSGIKNYTGNGEVLILKFKVLEGASDGLAAVTLSGFDIIDADENGITAAVTPGGVNVITRLPGDVNGDGEIDTKDALRLKKYLAGMDVEINLFNTDVNGDNKVSSIDLLRLMKHLAGISTVLQ